eukprot:TRINITY_DN14050_c0_g1_i1.p1 TRINITY_DN14050_c0_g1~~TRINITY_DN14050_c0_g1_i1.p1  ORF type:complete len:638 (-),score=75.16 TRINITY_DN14050_c0_g1_i1:199-2112(-)
MGMHTQQEASRLSNIPLQKNSGCSGSDEWSTQEPSGSAESALDPISEPEQEPVLSHTEPALPPVSWQRTGTYNHGSKVWRRASVQTKHEAVALPPAKPSKDAQRYSSLHSRSGLDDVLLWFGLLSREYGMKLLLLLHCSQHLLKGIVQQFQGAAVMWLLREYQVTGPKMQVYLSIANSAWALKPVLGCVSDMIPVMGYRKAPYVLVASFAGVACTTLIGLSDINSMGPLGVVACLFGMVFQASTCDLLTEAKYSEEIQEKPNFGPDLIAYVWGGISIGGMIAISVVGWMITHLGARAVFLACIAPAAAIVLPTCMNFFQEVQLSPDMISTIRRRFKEQTGVIYLCALMSGLSMALSAVGVLAQSHDINCVAALVVIILMLPSFHIILRPEIAKVNTFFTLQACCGITISGATFYFYTDQPSQYPEGPHFSVAFFASVLGLVSSGMSVLGLAVYTKYMKDWSFRSLFLMSNILLTILSLLDAVLFRRLNVAFGMPDAFFVLGSSVSTVVVRQWQWMPGIVLMSQLCPAGMEATTFALLAGCANIGSQVSDYLGAFLLHRLDVHPVGAPNESHQFENLWKASMVATLLPGLTIVLIPFMIPDSKQTDNKLLLGNPTSATWGSPWSRWCKEQCREDREDM